MDHLRNAIISLNGVSVKTGLDHNPAGLKALDDTILRSADALTKKEDKYRRKAFSVMPSTG